MLLADFIEKERLEKGEGLGQTVSVSQSGMYKCIPARVTAPLLTCFSSSFISQKYFMLKRDQP